MSTEQGNSAKESRVKREKEPTWTIAVIPDTVIGTRRRGREQEERREGLPRAVDLPGGSVGKNLPATQAAWF